MVKGYFGIAKLKEEAPKEEVEFGIQKIYGFKSKAGNLEGYSTFIGLVIEESAGIRLQVKTSFCTTTAVNQCLVTQSNCIYTSF
jgi:hypothetical protein